VLTIAGFDPSSGAGITADLKTIAAFGCYGVAAITAMTVQNTQGVSRMERVAGRLLWDSLAALAADNDFSAIKLGMLGTGDIAEVVTKFLAGQSKVPLVIDPVLSSSGGVSLLDEDSEFMMCEHLIPLATVITPNVQEAGILTAGKVRNPGEAKTAAKKLRMLGAANVVITGGHLPENADLLLTESGHFMEFAGPKIDSKATHGTGCAFSTAIACGLAKKKNLPDAIREAKEYVRQAIENAYPVGKGTGPMNHLFRLK
jgi:hydroxymethylpyrimidine/phosphomethylpyrimidine kinase